MTRLVINDAHEQLGHGTGVKHFLTELRAHYLIVKERRAIKNVVETCQECPRKFNSRTAGQMMALLAKVRCTQSLRAFENIGLDYARPYKTKQGRGRQRTHLEMVYSMDTGSFLYAFSRMTSKRRMPKFIVSDDGSNFTAPKKEICALVKKISGG